MKQHITKKQWEEINSENKMVILDITQPGWKSAKIELITIGQMIEFLAVHHIDGMGKSRKEKKLKKYERNDRLDNLITLCFKCHKKCHPYKLEKWARKYDKCIKCLTINYRHRGLGLCIRCYNHLNDKTKKRREYKREWYQNKKLITKDLQFI